MQPSMHPAADRAGGGCEEACCWRGARPGGAAVAGRSGDWAPLRGCCSVLATCGLDLVHPLHSDFRLNAHRAAMRTSRSGHDKHTAACIRRSMSFWRGCAARPSRSRPKRTGPAQRCDAHASLLGFWHRTPPCDGVLRGRMLQKLRCDCAASFQQIVLPPFVDICRTIAMMTSGMAASAAVPASQGPASQAAAAGEPADRAAAAF